VHAEDLGRAYAIALATAAPGSHDAVADSEPIRLQDLTDVATDAMHMKRAVGVGLSQMALARAAAGYAADAFVRVDVRRPPFARHRFGAALDRGCFHYLPPGERPRYGDELRRVLRPGGKLLLRASLRAAGVRNDIDEAVIRGAFAAWQIEHIYRAAVPGDTRTLEVILARLSTT
jgi:SAM-dependent methyltransferase